MFAQGSTRHLITATTVCVTDVLRPAVAARKCKFAEILPQICGKPQQDKQGSYAILNANFPTFSRLNFSK